MPGVAQIDTGVISGRVTDSTGAVVPGAPVTVTQIETNTESKSETNNEGVYRVPSLRPGPYKVSVAAPGFKTSVRDGLTLRIGENLGVDVKLEVGAVTESIQVTNPLPLLETQTSSTGQVMDGAYFYSLPNYQHWEKGVLFYTPQVQSSNSPWAGSLGNWSINGGSAFQIGYFEDGQLATRMDGGTTINSISVGVEEVKVLSTVLPAEYGHATTGAISVVKTGGTNLVHGTGGELFKNNAMFHRRFFQDKTNTQGNVHNLFQQPDFMLSGPIYIPKLYNGKNRTFFQVAGSYHVDRSSNASSYSVPTAAELGGDFNFPDVTANRIYDPASTSGTFAAGNLSRTSFPNNMIPTSRFSSMWNAIMANKPFASPTSAGTQNPTGPTSNIVSEGAGRYYNLATQVRLDHNFTDRFKVFGSLIINNNHQPVINNAIVYAPYDAQQRYTLTLQNVASIGFTWTISPTFISETRVGEYRQTNNPFSASPDYQFAIAKTVPNLPANVYLNPIGTGLTQGTYGNSSLGMGTLNTSVNNNHQLRQDFTKVWGTHAIKTGYEWLWQNQVSHDIGNPRLTLGFGGTNGLQGNGQGIPNTGGITLADVMLGYVTSYSYAQQGASLLPEDSIHSLYVQDDWRIRSNLTLNLGVRYSTESPAHGKFPGQMSVGSLTTPDTYFPNSISGVVTCPSGGCVGGWTQPKGGLYKRDNNNFQPRIGFAWNVTPNMVIRGGWALMNLDMNLWWSNQSEIGGGNFLQTGTISQPNNVYTPLFNISQGVPAPIYPTKLANGTIPSAGTNPSGRANGTLTIIQQNFHNPYTENWNLSIQRALKKNYMVEVTYSGSHNVGFQGNYNWQSRPYATGTDANGNVINLADPINLQYRNTWVQNSTLTQAYKPFPSWNNVNYVCNCISMIYHSGTVKVEKRYSSGLTFLAFVTYQKGLQNAPGNLFQSNNLNRGVTGITQKYRFTSSMTYELPFGKGKPLLNKSRLLNWLTGGWSLAWNYSMWAPSPISTGYSNASYVNPATGALGSRQDYPGYEPLPGGQLFRIQDPKLRDNWQDIGNNRFVQSGQNPLVTNCGAPIVNWGNNCVVVAPSFTNGNMPANMWSPQRIIAANASMYKDFPIKERVKAQIRLDYFNPFKWFNWSQLNTTMAQNNPAIFATPGLNDFGDSTAGGPAQMQLSFRIKF